MTVSDEELLALGRVLHRYLTESQGWRCLYDQGGLWFSVDGKVSVSVLEADLLEPYEGPNNHGSEQQT